MDKTKDQGLQLQKISLVLQFFRLLIEALR